MFETQEDLWEYIAKNYIEVTDNRIDDSHWDLACPKCKVTRGFQVIKADLSGVYDIIYNPNNPSRFTEDFNSPITYLFRCPVCRSFKQWIVYRKVEIYKSLPRNVNYYRVTSVPAEGLEDIDELPDKPESLRVAYRQAIRAMDANAPLAAAAMFRRAVQVITRELLGAKPGNLAKELETIVGKVYNGATVTKNFADVAYIVKEAGNQGAHPDSDPDLLDFTPQDASDLQQVFMELVIELFVVPAAIEKAKADFLARRKIVPKP
jgi:hypothetical protein